MIENLIALEGLKGPDAWSLIHEEAPTVRGPRFGC